MALINRAAVQDQPELKREVITVEALGGDVIVTEMTLSDRLDFETVLRGDRKPATKDGASPADTTSEATGARSSRRPSVNRYVPHLLAMTVLDADDEPVFHVKQWQAFGARNRDVCIQLFNTAMRLSGFDDGEQRKNS